MKDYKLNTALIDKISSIGKSKKVAVGIVEKQTHTDGIDMAYLQAIHHYGVISKNIDDPTNEENIINIPPRDAYIEPLTQQKNLLNKIPNLIRNLDDPTNEEDILNIIGKQILENIVKQSFRTGGFGKWEALSQSTINKKGHSTILVDKGELMNAQSFKVIDK